MAPTFRQLQYFVVLSEELNFGRAAHRLNISQPPLSAAIRQLEEDLGARLFTRDSKHVSLTPAGAAFGERARRLLSYLDETLEITRRAAESVAVELRVGFAPSMLFRRLPDFLRAFEARHPTARITLCELNSAMQFDALLRGQIDIGFIHGLPLPEGVDSILLMDEPFICCVPAQHRLAQAPFVSLRELAQERFVTFSRPLAPNYHDRIMTLLRGARVEPQIVHEVGHWLTVLALVANGIGIALVPQCLARAKFADVAYLPLDQDYGRHEARCIWLSGQENADHANEARDLMVDVVRDVLRIEPKPA
jgi:DNA-binding transcriptional LysR family regulator